MEATMYDRQSSLERSRKVAITQAQLYGARKVEASFITSENPNKLENHSSSVTAHITLLSKDDDFRSFTVIKGAEILERKEITAGEIAAMGFGSDERLIIFGTGPASIELKAIQKMTRTFDGVDVTFDEIQEAVKNNPTIAEIPKKEALEAIKLGGTVAFGEHQNEHARALNTRRM